MEKAAITKYAQHVKSHPMEKTFLYKKVMVVDDNAMDRYITTEIVRKYSFAEEVSMYPSVSEALVYLRSLESAPASFPPVIFLDVNMPVMDGFDFLDNYLKLPQNLQKRCTIIMISATNSEEDFARIHTYPVVRMFFRKPLSEAILEEIRKVLVTEVSY